MTFDEIGALDASALNLAIEAWCYGKCWEWKPLPYGSTISGWFLNGIFQGYQNMPATHTQDWNACMPLAWRYHIDLRMPGGVSSVKGSGEAFVLANDGLCSIHFTTEAEARMAICCMALYAAQEGGDAH